MDSQKSRFLNLPLEIRYQIYEHVFGHKTVMIVGDSTRILHCLCPVQNEKYHFLSIRHADRHVTNWCGCYTHVRDSGLGVPRIPLLLTCQQMYAEALPVLWSLNPLHIECSSAQKFQALAALERAIAPRSFHAIRSLEVSFIHCYPRKRCVQTLDDDWFLAWRALWAVAKRMTGLRRIRAWIKMDQEPGGNVMTAEQERRFFAPLMDLLWIKDFRVEVSWPANGESESLLQDAPFQLVRSDMPIPGMFEFKYGQ